MSFALQHASLEVRKAAAIRSIRQGTFRPVEHETVLAIVWSRNDEKIQITKDNAEYASQFTWREIKDQF